jgi:glucan 1,3-beta-glucosidase
LFNLPVPRVLLLLTQDTQEPGLLLPTFLWFSSRHSLLVVSLKNIFGKMFFSSAVVLGLSTCAFALNARYDSGYAVRAEISAPAAVSVSKGPRPTHAHNASEVLYPSRTAIPSPVKPSPTGPANSSCAPYWLENIKHQGLASFNANPDSYTVFRNVKDYGAKGDGIADDTAAIQRAITEGNRCTPGFCESSTNTPAVVYFPGGTYLISAPIIDYYYTQVCLFFP